MITAQLLKDNTITASYEDGTSENVNSGHANKALSNETRLLAESFAYLADTSLETYQEITFTGMVIRSTGEVFDPLQSVPTDKRLSTFANIIFNAEVKTAFIDSLPIKEIPVIESKQGTVRVHRKDELGEYMYQAVSKDVEDFEIVDNVAQVVTVTREFQEPIVDIYPVEKDGIPVMVEVPVLGTDGEQMTIEKLVYRSELYSRSELEAM